MASPPSRWMSSSPMTSTTKSRLCATTSLSPRMEVEMPDRSVPVDCHSSGVWDGMGWAGGGEILER
jgi:hypothetical protein